uniref:Sof1-like protein domain-containing protein n=1 Tax=Chromera velia CCMP2878 TaxID=1169474 RepID=A0A0G4HH84_9ALVE|eukprot:Cvel_27547.t1-p1 / transcript=Cvel_27547.t1 / gene=Cvel_27547 / organism=Chromera_velia_CCMP2878 / gene_product=DDB1- and CUL4-associated factor 13, putative / transcript_product=DDB1- and CUL4-associated factor 13, putative / location=Cvel_scaffold3458:695-4939(+) / protein_length=270 / sequence_SO=supercontig / SO=protein_coding / is_pseudo=false
MSVNGCRFSPAEPNMFASSGSDNSVILYDLRANTPLRKCIMKMRSNALAFNPHYPLSFCVANDDSSLYTFDIRNMKEASHVHRDFVNAAMDVKFSPTGLEILGASFDGTIRIWERLGMRSRDVYHTRRMHRVLCCEFSPDSRFVVSGSADTNVRIWKAKASEALGPRPQREKRAIAYREALKKKFGHMPEIKRIIRHHHVPKYIKNAGEKRKVMKEAQKRKEENRIRHSKPGTVERTRATKQAVLGIGSSKIDREGKGRGQRAFDVGAAP